MSTIDFSCPQCGHTMKLPVALIGKKGKCPKCGVVNEITNPVGTQQTAPVTQQQPTPPQQPDPFQQQIPPQQPATPQNPLGGMPQAPAGSLGGMPNPPQQSVEHSNPVGNNIQDPSNPYLTPNTSGQSVQLSQPAAPQPVQFAHHSNQLPTYIMPSVSIQDSEEFDVSKQTLIEMDAARLLGQANTRLAKKKQIRTDVRGNSYFITAMVAGICLLLLCVGIAYFVGQKGSDIVGESLDQARDGMEGIGENIQKNYRNPDK